MAALPDQTQSNQLPEYDALRRRLKGQFQQKAQTDQDALQRRYAANGMIGSGAYGKEQQLQADQSNRDEADATAQLDFQQAGEIQRRKEVTEGRDFAKSEREGAQLFNKDLFDRDMQFKQKVQDSEQTWKGLDAAFREKEFNASQQANKTNEFTALGGDKGGPGALKAYETSMYRRYGANWREYK